MKNKGKERRQSKEKIKRQRAQWMKGKCQEVINMRQYIKQIQEIKYNFKMLDNER